MERGAVCADEKGVRVGDVGGDGIEDAGRRFDNVDLLGGVGGEVDFMVDELEHGVFDNEAEEARVGAGAKRDDLFLLVGIGV